MQRALKCYGLSDIGLNRRDNQDVWISLPEIGFFALADGMGGRNGGKIAAKETISVLEKTLKKLFEKSNSFQSCHNLSLELKACIELANQRIYNISRAEKSLLGMGTTLCCLLWTKNIVCYAHVGDSRIYRLHKKKLELLTKDHSLISSWMDHKKETPRPPKHIITRAIGPHLLANPDVAYHEAEDQDIYLLCSDGLSDKVEKEELEEILTSFPLEKAADLMILSAKNRGGHDNITALIIESKTIHDPHLPRS